ncbi:MAG: aldo/keto reductase [Candidatus Rokubacteria bacterium]|nr:aldo/keto reductase [Chloroflexota bacterium]MBM4441477.1 aldo/keto reductase [Candidatus Rokubacteria bacterium]
MQTRRLGRLWPVSALTLGGGGIGQVWGPTTREESVATIREAVERGVTLVDLAPTYGDGEAERAVGEAFAGRLPDGVRVTTKHGLGTVPAGEVEGRLRASLEASLERTRLDRVDLFFLHSTIVPDDGVPADPALAARATARRLFVEAARPAFERLVTEGRVGAWGITGIGVPSAVIATLGEDPAPGAVQCIANLLDSPGALRRSEEPARPREIMRAAKARGVGVMGIRAVQAGALADAFDRPLAGDHADMRDYRLAAPFRALARELGVSAAYLAHRYALSMADVDTVVLGVKNREELRECLRAEADGPLASDVIARIDAAVGRA